MNKVKRLEFRKFRPFAFALSLFLLFQTCSPKLKMFVEENGLIVVEAEDFYSQELTEVRQWHRIDAAYNQSIQPDPDKNHASTASGNAYLEILPDTRTTHDDQLIRGENFSNEPGKIAVLHYQVKFKTPGKYYVWVRAFSTGTEDNGIHVGLDGKWVKSGQRMQWCEGKNEWTWASKQRTQEVHCGVEKQIFLEIDKPGLHTISFSMREDGFEFDQWVMNKAYSYE